MERTREREREKKWELSEGAWTRDKEGKLEGERTNRQRTQQALSWCHYPPEECRETK